MDKRHIHITEEMLQIAKHMVSQGHSKKEVYDAIGVTREAAYYRYKVGDEMFLKLKDILSLVDQKYLITEKQREKALELAKKGKSPSVIAGKINIPIRIWRDRIRKGEESFVELGEEIDNIGLEFWEQLLIDNINVRAFQASAYNNYMRHRFTEYKPIEQAKQVDNRPISINFSVDGVSKPITSEAELMEREGLKNEEKDSLNDLLKAKEMDLTNK